MEKHLKCIICPVGCDIAAEFNEATKDVSDISGNECKKGISFTMDELIKPLRLLTTTIAVDSAISARLPVRSDIPVPKEKMPEMVKEVKKIAVKAPVKAGQVIAEDFMGMGIRILSGAAIDS